MTQRGAILLFILLLLGLFSFAAPLAAQQSFFSAMDDDAFLRWLREFRSVPPRGPSALALPGEKCGFAVTGEIIRRIPSLSAARLAQLRAILLPRPTDSSIVSPSGHFLIHYSVGTSDEPALLDASGNRIPGTAYPYAMEAAKAFDRAWAMEIDTAGYLAPPFLSGDTRYQVYINAQQPGYYGVTNPVQNLPPIGVAPRYTSYIEVDNDFLGLYTTGVKGLQVTAAHEFHHAIQLGSYGSWNYDAEGWFYELTSTYFEDYVYPQINDYYYYLTGIPSIFRNPERSVVQRLIGDGYDLAVWGKYLEKRFGIGMMRTTWEKIRDDIPITASDKALRTATTDLPTEYCIFDRWNFFTGYRAGEGETYTEARDYPLIAFRQSIELLNGAAAAADSLGPFGSHYIQTYKGADTVTFIISNTDLASAANHRLVYTPYALEVRLGYGGSGFVQLSNGWSYKFAPGAANLLCISPTVGVVGGVPSDLRIYPNPYDPANDPYLTISLPGLISQTKAEVRIYSTSMDLRYSLASVELKREGGEVKIKLSPDSSPPLELSSGVYFFTVAYGGIVQIGKFAVVRRGPQ